MALSSRRETVAVTGGTNGEVTDGSAGEESMGPRLKQHGASFFVVLFLLVRSKKKTKKTI